MFFAPPNPVIPDEYAYFSAIIAGNIEQVEQWIRGRPSNIARAINEVGLDLAVTHNHANINELIKEYIKAEIIKRLQRCRDPRDPEQVFYEWKIAKKHTYADYQLYDAARRFDSQKMLSLLSFGAKPNTFFNNETILYIAAKHGSDQALMPSNRSQAPRTTRQVLLTIKYLLQYNADPLLPIYNKTLCEHLTQGISNLSDEHKKLYSDIVTLLKDGPHALDRQRLTDTPNNPENSAQLILHDQEEHPSYAWKVQHLRNSLVYTRNIAQFYGETINFHAHQPWVIFLFTCTDLKSPVHDVIIARHGNTSGDPTKEGIISIIISARAGVQQRFMQLFWQAEIGTRLLTNFYDNPRLCYGLTTTCFPPEEQERIRKVLNVIDSLSQVSPAMRAIMEDMLQPQIKEKTNRMLAYPSLTQLDPPYFYHSENNISIGDDYYATFKEDDAVIATEIPKIHQAIFNDDIATVVQCLKEDPKQANSKDPWGIMAYELALNLTASFEMLDCLLAARAKYPPKSLGDQDSLHRWPMVVNGSCIINCDMTEEQKIEESNRYTQAHKAYAKLITTSIPRRTALHEACIAGDVAKVQTILDEQPKRLDEQDPRGYTPLLLAAANGHAGLVRMLLRPKCIK